MSKSKTPVTDRLVRLWDAAVEAEHSSWADLSDDDLYSIQAILWGMHQDILMEWTRRQMRKADPKR